MEKVARLRVSSDERWNDIASILEHLFPHRFDWSDLFLPVPEVPVAVAPHEKLSYSEDEAASKLTVHFSEQEIAALRERIGSTRTGPLNLAEVRKAVGA